LTEHCVCYEVFVVFRNHARKMLRYNLKLSHHRFLPHTSNSLITIIQSFDAMQSGLLTTSLRKLQISTRSYCTTTASNPPQPQFNARRKRRGGRTPWTEDQPVSRPLLIHRINAHRHYMLRVGFETTIPVLKRTKTAHGLEPMAAVIGNFSITMTWDTDTEATSTLCNIRHRLAWYMGGSAFETRSRRMLWISNIPAGLAVDKVSAQNYACYIAFASSSGCMNMRAGCHTLRSSC
jgi:hypothetical protein